MEADAVPEAEFCIRRKKHLAVFQKCISLGQAAPVPHTAASVVSVLITIAAVGATTVSVPYFVNTIGAVDVHTATSISAVHSVAFAANGLAAPSTKRTATASFRTLPVGVAAVKGHASNDIYNIEQQYAALRV